MKRHLTLVVLTVAALSMLLAPAASAEGEWNFGIGTGLFGLNIDGDIGLGTVGGSAIRLSGSLDSDETRELLESGFGLGGYAAKDKWVLSYSAGQLELEDTLNGTGPGGASVASTVNFTGTVAEFSAAYPFATTGKHVWGVLGGVRYMKHELDFGLEIGGNPAIDRNIDNDWTDVLIGLTHGTQLGEKWSWTNHIDAGFGGSEGTYFAKTGFNWKFAKSWTTSFYAKITAIEFENDNPGDPGWYLYDVDEFGLGVNILYTF